MSKSKKTVSFISWNTTSFLINKLEELYHQQKITYYIFIFHHAEGDDLYDHHHVILFPHVPLDYFDLKAQFIEPQKNGLLPLGISFQPKYVSKDCEYDWILYVLHDPDYLKSKYKEVKKYIYSRDKLISPDERTLQDMISTAYSQTEFHKDRIINDLLKKGVSPSYLIENGYIPIKDACSYHHYIQMTKEE